MAIASHRSTCGSIEESGPFWITADWLIDGSGSPARRDPVLKVRRGRVEALADSREIPESQALLDLTGCTLLPGLVDSHVHLGWSGTDDPQARRQQRQASWSRARKVIGRHLAQHRNCGLIAVRDGGDRWGFVLRYCRQQETPPSLPRVRTAGRAWHRRGRYGSLIGRSPEPHRPLAAALDGDPDPVDHVKIVNSGLNSLEDFGRQTRPQFDLDEMRAAVRVSRRRGRPVMVHANGLLPVRIAVEAGCDSIEHGFFMGRDNLARMAQWGTVWVPTAVTMLAYAENAAALSPARRTVCRRNLDHQLEQLRLARELGVSVAVGTDAGSLGVHHGRALRRELGLLMQAGYPAEEAVRSASANGARLLRLPGGRIQAGAVATMVAVRGSPVDLPASLARIECVLFQGRISGPAGCVQ